MLTTARQHPQLQEMNHLDNIYEGLKPEYRDFHNLDELIGLADDYELLKRGEARHN